MINVAQSGKETNENSSCSRLLFKAPGHTLPGTRARNALGRRTAGVGISIEISIWILFQKPQSFTYLFLRRSQPPPFLSHPHRNILDSHVLKVTLASAFRQEDQVRRAGTLDQSRVFDLAQVLAGLLGQPSTGQVGFLDLQRRVRREPSLVVHLVGSLVVFSDRRESLIFFFWKY